MSRTLHLFGTECSAMMVPIHALQWYRFADTVRLSDLKYKITVLSSQLSSLKLRHDIMEEAKEEILSNKSNIDADTLKIVYNQAKKFVPTLHHTFEDLLNPHCSCL